MGNVGFQIVRDLLTIHKDFTDKHIKQVNQCNRTIKVAKDKNSELIIDSPNSLDEVTNDLGSIILEQSNRLSLKLFQERFTQRPYWPLTELDSVFNNSTENDITIITSRYTFTNINEDLSQANIEKIRTKYKSIPSKSLLEEINKLLKLRSNIIASSYNINDEQDLLQKQKEISDISKRLDLMIKGFTSKGKIDLRRIENIRYSLFGIKELALYFKEKNYKGLTIMVVNPVDEASHIFRLYYGRNPKKVIGLSDNERFRWEHFVFDKLKAKGIRNVDKLFIPVVGFHNEYHSGLLHQSFYLKDDNTKKIRPLNEIIKGCEWKEIYEEEKDFGLREFEKLKSSSDDTSPAVINIIKAYAGDYQFPLRGSCFELLNGIEMSIGRPFMFVNHQEAPVQAFDSYTISGFEKDIITKGIEYESTVLDELRKYCLIQGSINAQQVRALGDYSYVIQQIIDASRMQEEKRLTQQTFIKSQLKDPEMQKEMERLKKQKIKDSLKGL